MRPIYIVCIPKIICGLLLLAFSFLSCKKLVDVNPPLNSTTGASVYTLDATAIAVLTGVYASLGQGSFATGNNSISLYCGLSADEWTLDNSISSSDSKTYFYSNSLFTNSTTNVLGAGDQWEGLYHYIFICNSAIEGLTESSSLTPSVKQQLLGEAKFLRALCYFYLVNLYGDVPLAIKTDYTVNAVLARAPNTQVYQQIITDLKDARDLFSNNYLDGSLLKITSERVRPNKGAATALLARAYLYNGDYTNAEAEATSAISYTAIYDTVSLNDGVFNMNSKEAIWQLQPVNFGWNTEDARVFILTGAPNSNNPVYLSSSILNEFEPNDLRKANWTDSLIVSGNTYYYPYKYKSAEYGDPVTEYLMVLRLAEQYLIRAEARAQNNNINGAQADLNVIRTRAGLPNTAANDKTSLLTAILHERKVELFTEWGHRWLDLKRTGNIDAVMTAATPSKANGVSWISFQQLYPLPADQILKAVNLVQNPGY